MTSTHLTDPDRDVRAMTKAVLGEAELPTHWYNLAADLPVPMPPYLHPGTGEPLVGEDMAPLFPAALIEQEMTGERFVPIPEPVREVYRSWRPSPLYRAHRLERALGRRRGSTTSTRASARSAATSRTPPWRRPTTTPPRASGG